MNRAGNLKLHPVLRCALLWVLLAAAASAPAQAPPGETAPAGGEARPCVPAGDTPAPGAEPGGDGSESEPCADPSDAAEPEDAPPGPEAAVEEDMAIEAAADEVFTPGDEISEDYPIPLPSDI